MARSASPWFWERRNCWAVIVDGQRHVLGEHPQDAPPPRKKNRKWIVPKPILDRYDDLKMTLRGKPAITPAFKPTLTVGIVFEKYLEWCQVNRSERTYEWSRNHIQSFCNTLKLRDDPVNPKTLPASELAPFHVTEWVDSHRTPKPGRRAWGDNHRRGAITAVVRAFSWAAKQRHIPENPIRGIEKPPAKRREQVLTQAEFADLLSEVSDAAFRDVLEFCWETGCRVQEIRLLASRHHKSERGRFELPPAEAKGKKRWRYIYLTSRATKIVNPLLLKHPEGPIFRNAAGNPWDAQNFNCRFCRLQRRLGREAISALDPECVKALARRLKKTKIDHGKTVTKTQNELLREARKKLAGAAAAKAGKKYALTSIRHSFATRLLESGCDHITVAALMGHVDATMLAKVYSHVGEKTDFLRDELLRASGGDTLAA